ncbi:MAG: hypothetical protein U0572_00325 [Phycisphaerales bacterium]
MVAPRATNEVIFPAPFDCDPFASRRTGTEGLRRPWEELFRSEQVHEVLAHLCKPERRMRPDSERPALVHVEVLAAKQAGERVGIHRVMARLGWLTTFELCCTQRRATDDDSRRE